MVDARHHSDAGRYCLEGLSESNQCGRTEIGHILPFNVYNLVPRLQASQVGTTALHHRQDVAGPSATQSEAECLWPVLIGGWETKNWRMDGKTKFWREQIGSLSV